MITVILKSENNYPLEEIILDIEYLRLDYQEKIKQILKIIETSIKEKTFPNLVIDCRDNT